MLEQAVRDGVVDRNVARVTGWQREYQRAEDELDDTRSLALLSWEALTTLADLLVTRSYGQFTGWGHIVTFAACTAARIGEVSGVRAGDIDRATWTWTVQRQTTPGPGGRIDKGTKGKRARKVPIIEEVRPMVIERLDSAAGPGRPAVHRAAGRPDQYRGAAGRYALGRGGHGAGLRALAAARPAAHRPQLASRCRRQGARTAEDRRARFAEHHAAVLAPGSALDRGGRIGAQRPLARSQKSPRVPKRSPTPSRLVGISGSS